MNKKVLFIILIIISVFIIGTGVFISLNNKPTNNNVDPPVQESPEEKALKVVIERSGEDKDKYTFNRIDEEGHYVFNRKDDDSIEIVVDVENDSYIIKVKEKTKGA